MFFGMSFSDARIFFVVCGQQHLEQSSNMILFHASAHSHSVIHSAKSNRP